MKVTVERRQQKTKLLPKSVDFKKDTYNILIQQDVGLGIVDSPLLFLYQQGTEVGRQVHPNPIR